MGLLKRLEEAGMNKPRVLIVDDEPGTVDMLKLYFEMFHFDVTIAFLGGGSFGRSRSPNTGCHRP